MKNASKHRVNFGVTMMKFASMRLVFEVVKYFVARWRRHILKWTASFAEYDSFVDVWNFECNPDLIVEIKGKG